MTKYKNLVKKLRNQAKKKNSECLYVLYKLYFCNIGSDNISDVFPDVLLNKSNVQHKKVSGFSIGKCCMTGF